MADNKLAKHLTDIELLLNQEKASFMKRWKEPLVPNSKLSDFSRIRTLGTGSFGRVMLVKHLSTKKIYAMKIMEKGHVVKMKQVEHTISEMKTLDAVKFQFVVNMDFFFKDNVYIYIIMPFINGGEMFTYLRQMKKFEENHSKFYAAQVVLAFDYLHFLGIVYRDLKPENILLDHDGYIKITDLGFCKKIDKERTYTLCGTPEYIAPEILQGKGYNYGVDWWSLGVLIYEMVAGYPPFMSREPMKIYGKIVAGRFTSPSHFSKSLRELLPNLIQVDRSKRFGILKNGSKDIKAHDWFKAVDWDAILKRTATPFYSPAVSGDEDAQHFDDYEEEELRVSPIDEHAEEFKQIVV